MSLPVTPRLNLFPGGIPRAVTLSYDDGVVEDRRLVEILNRHGLKASFHLNSGFLGRENKLRPDEVASLFEGHEVSAHSVTHPHLTDVPLSEVAAQLVDDRRALEALCGYPVRGMSYPFGTYDDALVSHLPSYGIEYSRTVASHGGFHVPADLLRWHPTCHHNDGLAAKTDAFFSEDPRGRLRLFYVWGHSYEFPRNDNWQVIEVFAERVGREREAGRVWCATNIEIADYLRALRQLRASIDGTVLYNPTALSLWVTWSERAVEIPAGGTVRFSEARV